MKIKHNIKRTGKKLEGQILDVVFEKGEERGDCKCIYNTTGDLYIRSVCNPDLCGKKIFIWGEDIEKDNEQISYTYNTEEEAQKMLDFINTFVEKEEKTFPREVYVSVESEENAKDSKEKRICLGNFNGLYLCISFGDEENFKDGKKYHTLCWKYISEIGEVKERKINATDEQWEEIQMILKLK